MPDLEFTESFTRAMLTDATRAVATQLGYASTEAFLADAPAARMLFQAMHERITRYTAA